MHQQNKLITETQSFNSSRKDTVLLKTAVLQQVIGSDKYSGSPTVVLQKDPSRKTPKKKNYRKINHSTRLRRFFKKLVRAVRRYTKKVFCV